MSAEATGIYKLPERNKPYLQLLKMLGVLVVLMAVWHSGLSSWAAYRMANSAGGWFRELGEPIVTLGGLPVMKPWAWLTWDAGLAKVPAFKPLLSPLYLAATASGLLIPLLKTLMLRPKYHSADVHGSARWATREEIAQMGLIDSDK